jgi:hypothetical protein
MPQDDDPFVRHVYVKSRHVRHPARGDIVFVRESLTVRGAVRTSAVRCHRGGRVTVRLPRGVGDLIFGKSVTADRPRQFEPDDVVRVPDEISLGLLRKLR